MFTTEFASLIAVIGGIGDLGSAIARRLAKVGEREVIGSQNPAKAVETAIRLTAATARSVGAAGNIQTELVILTEPLASQEAALRKIGEAIAAKNVVDTTVPLVPPKVKRVRLPPEGSAAVRAQKILVDGIHVVSAFQNTAAHNTAAHKLVTDGVVDRDVLALGKDKLARYSVVRLVGACGLRILNTGTLVKSTAAEPLTPSLNFINKQDTVDGSGIRITGIKC
ncbi:MAG: NADPH-dependent F420 reductase [Gammaproteobacteria bacterium]|nr:NADPH-dependent F420 reductase [Gammaproteobacteria bacterium]